MESLSVVLGTLKIFGAILFVALAVAFRFGRVFSLSLWIHLVLQALVVVSYSWDTSVAAGHRIDHPLGFALATLPFIGVMPTLYLAIRSTAEGNNRSISGIITCATMGIGGLVIILSAILPGWNVVLPGPGAPPPTAWAWNGWHALWLTASIAAAIRSRTEKDPNRRGELRILRWLTAFAAISLILSVSLENLSLELDFLVTPMVMILAAYAAIALLITRAPMLLRESRERYAGSDLDEEAVRELALKAERRLKEREMWKRDNLTLAVVAETCAASPRDLSQAINRYFGTGFPAWINGFRLEDAEKRLIQSNTTVAEIAFEVGFHSLSSFNSAFRLRRGLTPTQWRKATNDTMT